MILSSEEKSKVIKGRKEKTEKARVKDKARLPSLWETSKREERKKEEKNKNKTTKNSFHIHENIKINKKEMKNKNNKKRSLIVFKPRVIFCSLQFCGRVQCRVPLCCNG